MSTSEQNYMSSVRADVRAFWEAYQKIRTKQDQWNALDYGNNPFSGEANNLGVTSAMVGSVVFDTMNAIKTLMDTGHATNVAKLL